MALGTAKRNEQVKDEYLRSFDSLISFRARLESAIYARFLLAKSLVGFIENNPNLDDQDFLLLSRDTLSVDSTMLGVRMTQGMNISFVYPESARLGLRGELLENTLPNWDREQLQRIITESTPYLGGPVIGPDSRKIFLLFFSQS